VLKERLPKEVRLNGSCSDGADDDRNDRVLLRVVMCRLRYSGIKNYLRSTMEQERTSDLALLAIERKAAKQLDVSSIIKQFASCKVRRRSRLTTA